MFEEWSGGSSSAVNDRPAAALRSSLIAEAQADLVAALDGASGMDDYERVESIRALEQLICTATAAQAALSVELDRSQRAAQAAAGERKASLGRGVGAQVGFARRVSPHRGQRLLGLAKVVAGEMPHTWSAWRQGRISEWQATLLARETACLSLVDRQCVDATLAGDAEALEAMGPRELGARAAALAAELDPESAVLRRRRAESERHVSLRPAPDTMTWLSALLPVKEGVAVLAALRAAADTGQTEGDDRGRGQIMADALVARVAGAAAATTEPTEPTAQVAPRVTLNLTMSAANLFAGDEEAAHLDGYGPIPAELARELVAGALSAHDEIEVRRLFLHPTTGQLQAMEARTRCFRGNLARFIRLRDRVCRTPWCEAPIRHLDHAADHHRGGPTTAVNGQGLCQACNEAKNAPGWRAGPAPGGVGTTLPTGIEYRTRPPALARIRRLPPRLRAITVDYVLAG